LFWSVNGILLGYGKRAAEGVKADLEPDLGRQ
jgi:hypothetical protein